MVLAICFDVAHDLQYYAPACRGFFLPKSVYGSSCHHSTYYIETGEPGGWTVEQLAGSWLVQYADGGSLHQWDATHPQAVSGEVPYRAIEWDRGVTLVLESQLAQATVPVPNPPAGTRWSLRSRTFISMQGVQISVFILLLTDAAVEISEITDATTYQAWYWVPDGSTHETPLFWSPEVARYCTKWIYGQPGSLMPKHDQLVVAADAVLTE